MTPPTGPDPLFEQVDDGRSPALTGDVNRLATEGPAATPEPLVDTEPQDAEVIESHDTPAPAPTSAGVFGITRTTLVPPPSRSSINSVVIPAAIDITSFD